MKVLIISHTALSTHNNMGKTILSLFSSFEKHELCQLYVYPMLPDVDKCSSHYRMTDKDVLKSYFKGKVHGRRIEADKIDTTQHALFQDSADEKLYRNKKNKTAFRVLLRDMMWKFAPWYNKELRQWIEEQQPTCLFVAPGMPKFLYDIAIKISQAYSLPMAVYICDDFYFTIPTGQSIPLLKKWQNRLLQKKTQKLFKYSQHIVTICDELSECYSEEFSLPSTTIMTGTSYEIAKSVKQTPEISRLTYMGNIRYNRYLCLAEIGRALDKINAKENKNYRLAIYSVEKDPEILSAFDSIASVDLCGFVSGEEFDNIFHSSQMFIHTEAFDEVNINLTKRSVSTKIADCLGSGIPVFAYAPENIASMQHLIKNDAAVTVTDSSQLYEKLRQTLRDSSLRNHIAKNGLKTAEQYHSSDRQSQKVKTTMQNITQKSVN